MKTAVISGASSGIGEACARVLSAQGWQVYLVARRQERIEALASEVGGHAIPLDVVEADSRDFQAVQRCDLLVNCAGCAIGLDKIETAKPDDWTAMFNTNVLGTLRLTQILLSRLVEAQGCIINITSTAALGGYEGGGGYCAAKSAERALTQSLRLEMKGLPVRITELLPGMVDTPEFSLNRFHGDIEKARSVYKDVDRPLIAEDIAQLVAMTAHLPAHVNIDEMTIRPVAQRGQHALFRGELGWHK